MARRKRPACCKHGIWLITLNYIRISNERPPARILVLGSADRWRKSAQNVVEHARRARQPRRREAVSKDRMHRHPWGPRNIRTRLRQSFRRHGRVHREPVSRLPPRVCRWRSANEGGRVDDWRRIYSRPHHGLGSLCRHGARKRQDGDSECKRFQIDHVPPIPAPARRAKSGSHNTIAKKANAAGLFP